MDSDQKLNTKDVEDFFFAMSIHAPSYNQWYKRYALLKLMDAGILRRIDWREQTISNF
jgi:hypothetical protein